MPDDLRARPTIRVLQLLRDGWTDASQRRAVERGEWEQLQPLAELAHPILAKAREQFDSDPERDASRGVIACSGDLRLDEVRQSQWRAGVWTDPSSGVRWVVAVGLAKGGHEDSDDFYEELDRALTSSGASHLLPLPMDLRLLRRESAAAEITDWELTIQSGVEDLLRQAITGNEGRASLVLPRPRGAEPMAEVRLIWQAIRDDDYNYEDFVVSFHNVHRPGSATAWTLVLRVLTSLAPPMQGWDVAGDMYSTMEGHGYADQRVDVLSAANLRGELLKAAPGEVSHYAHQKHIARSSVQGEGMRALCGIFFVPTQDPERLTVCPDCESIKSQLPA